LKLVSVPQGNFFLYPSIMLIDLYRLRELIYTDLRRIYTDKKKNKGVGSSPP